MATCNAIRMAHVQGHQNGTTPVDVAKCEEQQPVWGVAHVTGCAGSADRARRHVARGQCRRPIINWRRYTPSEAVRSQRRNSTSSKNEISRSITDRPSAASRSLSSAA